MEFSAPLLSSIYPFLKENQLSEVLIEEGIAVSFSKGTILMDYGASVDFIPILVKGAAVIFIHETLAGQDKFVYEVRPGALCSIVMLNCLSSTASEVKAICQEDIEALLLPKEKAIGWLGKYDNWREAIMSDFTVKYKVLLEKFK